MASQKPVFRLSMPGGSQPLCVALCLAAVLALAGCAPSIAQNAAPSRPERAPESSRAPKILTIAILREPTSLHQDLAGSLTTGGNRQVHLIAHNYLVVRNQQGTRVPQLAQELISLEKGTWVVNPDGTMDTTWKIRPNVQWQDGVPFTSDDLVFAFGVYRDPEIPSTAGAAIKSMSSVHARDPLSLAVHWSTIFVDADWGQGLIPMPRHLLEEEYRRDKANFVNSPRLGPEFVGLGPYRLTRWEPAVQMEFTRFDNYYLGRPPLDTVVLKFIGDPRAMISNILAESVDVLLPLGPDLEMALEVRQRWEGTGNQVTIAPTGAFRYLQIQHRIEYARPRNGLTTRLVRQAFYSATDRRAVADIATVGTAPIADSWIPPTHELYAQVEPWISQFPFDLNLARDRLAQAGWVRSAAGVLTHQSTGERFDVEIRSSPGAGAERILATIADGWTSVGAQPELTIVPAARSSDAEYRATLPGAGITGNVHDSFFTEALHSKHVAGPANRWTAANRSGFTRPAVDALYDQLGVTIAPPERLALHQALLHEAMEDVAIIPLYWELAPLLALKSVRGIGGMMDNTNTWNMFEWDKE